MRPLVPALAWLALAGGIAGASAAEAGPEADLPSAGDRGTVVLNLSGSLPLRSGATLFGEDEPTLHAATLELRQALRGDVPNLVLDLTGFDASLATAEEIAGLIRAERGDGGAAKNKRLSCLLDGTGNNALVVAAACDEVVASEAGVLDVRGIALETYYFAGALAKLGVSVHAVASGEWKTGHEPFTRSGPSEPGKRELTELAQELDRVLVELSSRGELTAEALAAARSAAPQAGVSARRLKLADATAEPGAWLQALPGPVHQGIESHPGSPSAGDLAGIMSIWNRLLHGEPVVKYAKAVAVVELDGEIVDGGRSNPGETVAGDDTTELFDELTDNDRIKAVVVRINSPGGSPTASDRIHHAIRRLAKRKPVVALFEQVCASGGYYIGCAADEIQVHRATITGSIGVFSIAPDATGALGLLGVTRFAVTTGPLADMDSPTAPWTPEREAAFARVNVAIDDRFQGLVADTRKLDRPTVQGLAGGRVYTGDQAVANHLADGIGNLATAVAAARTRAGISEPLPLERLPRGRGILSRFGLDGGSDGVLLALAPPSVRQAMVWIGRLRSAGVQPMVRANVPGTVK